MSGTYSPSLALFSVEQHVCPADYMNNVSGGTALQRPYIHKYVLIIYPCLHVRGGTCHTSVSPFDQTLHPFLRIWSPEHPGIQREFSLTHYLARKDGTYFEGQRSIHLHASLPRKPILSCLVMQMLLLNMHQSISSSLATVLLFF